MLRSMTGFGEAGRQVDGMHYAVELRSLNNRYFKVLFRMPETLSALEAELEVLLRSLIQRGSLTLTVRSTVDDAARQIHIDQQTLAYYVQQLETLATQLETGSLQIDGAALLNLPGVLQMGDEQPDRLDRLRPVILELAREAVARMDDMRCREGNMLGRELLEQMAVIEQHVIMVRQRAPQVVEEYHDRLHARVQELLARASLQLEKTDLLREVAIFADRCDVREEVTRITAHLEQFAQLVRSEESGPVGRTLDFLAQELLREANTIASKSNDAILSRAAVDIKSAIDRIKEQVQNVE